MRTLIAVPCMDTVQTRFMISLMMMKRTEDFCNFYFYMNSLTYDARNSITKEAIETGYDRVLWLDSDMSFGPELMEQLSQRIDEGRDYVSGLYFERKPPHRPTIYRKLMATEREGVAEVYRDYPESGIFEIAASGFGAVMTTVKLLRDVTERFGLPFTPITGFGEDMAFCIRAREAGYRLWCDSGIRAGHIGAKIFDEDDWEKKKTWVRA